MNRSTAVRPRRHRHHIDLRALISRAATAVDQVEAVTLSVIFGGVGLCQHGKGVGTVGGDTGVGVVDELACSKKGVSTLHFTSPRTGEIDDFVAGIRQIQLVGHQPVSCDLL